MRLSSMETPLGITVIGPTGQPLRVMRNAPYYQAAKELLVRALPAEQLWTKLQALVVSPFMAVIHWAERQGVLIAESEGGIRLGDAELSKATWMPLVNRCIRTGSPAAVLTLLRDYLGEHAATAPVANGCFHWRETPFGPKLGLVALRHLPADARVGDAVLHSAHPAKVGPEYLVSFECFERFDGSTDADEPVLRGLVGTVIAKANSESWAEDVLRQPVILGFNRTYRVEEGGESGWLEDMSSDSLADARQVAREIQDSGAEARIINRITGEVVALT